LTNTDAVMKDMGMSLNFTVENKIDDEREENLQIILPISPFSRPSG